MSFRSTYPHVTKTEGQPACLQRFPRVRIAQIVMDYLAHQIVMDYLAHGWSAEEMCRQHPYLTIAEAHAAMLHYWDHQDEIDQEIQIEWKQAERERAQATPPPFLARMRFNGA